jgi:hypothetical protein
MRCVVTIPSILDGPQGYPRKLPIVSSGLSSPSGPIAKIRYHYPRTICSEEMHVTLGHRAARQGLPLRALTFSIIGQRGYPMRCKESNSANM